MVSNTLKMTQDELIAVLERLRAKYGDDPEYKRLRKDLPKEWPV